MTTFNETHPALKGFSAFYDKEIRPGLEADELRRKQAVKKISVRIPVMLVVCCVIIFALWMKFRAPMIIFMGAAFSGVGAMGYGAYLLENVRSETKRQLMEGICGFVGWEFSPKVVDPPELGMMVKYGLLPKAFHRKSFEDKITGNAHGADFEALECHLEQKVKTKNGTSWRTIFRGAIMAIDFHREFLGTTLVLRDKGIFNSRKKKGMKRVGLVDPVFEKIFEAYGTDQVEARYLLTPDFMQKLVDLEASVNGKNIRFAFLDELLLIVIETPNRFEAGSMFKPLVDTGRTQKLLDEIAAVYGIVDGVMKPQSPLRSNT